MFGRATIRLGIGPHSSLLLVNDGRHRDIELYHAALANARTDCPAESSGHRNLPTAASAA